MDLIRRVGASKSACIGFCLAGLVGGLFLGRYGLDLPIASLVFVLPLVLVGLRHRQLALLAFFAMGLLVGLWRSGMVFNEVRKYQQYYTRPVTVIGKVIDDVGYEKSQTEFHISQILVNGEKLPGRIRVRGFGANNIKRGDKIQAQGTLNRTLGVSRQGALSFAQIQVLEQNTSWVEKLRSRFFASVTSALPEPQASFGLGFLVGVRTSLPEDFAEALAVVGLTHIIAVSGYNLTILVQLIRRLFAKRSAYQSVLFSILLIAGFLVMTGWSPSIARAAVIAGLSLLAWYYGRAVKPLILILLGAAITGFVNPLYVWGDAGWYLSFLAFAGVLILAPLITWRIWGEKHPNFLILLLLETLCAQALTLPYVAFLFGEVSLIAPLANILVGPLIPLTMLLVFTTGLVGLVSPILALWIALWARAILTINIWTIERLARISWAQAQIKIHWQLMLFLYLACAVVALWLWRSYRKKVGQRPQAQIDWNLV